MTKKIQVKMWTADANQIPSQSQTTPMSHAEDTILGKEFPGMDPMNQKDCLTHYGVLGMKWGVRRASRSSGSSKGGSSKKLSSIKSRVSKAKKNRDKNSVKNLSDQELKKRIARLELEKRYKSLNRENTNRGSKIAREILEGSARAIGQEIIRYGVGTGINTITGRKVIGVGDGNKKKKG